MHVKHANPLFIVKQYTRHLCCLWLRTVYRVMEREDKQGLIVSVNCGQVGHIGDGVAGSWYAGSAGHAHDLTLDGRTQHSA